MRSRSFGAGSAATRQIARIEPLGDALDDAALAGGVAALEDHHDLELLVLHPVLQLDQFALQPEQLLEIDPPIDGLIRGMVGELVGQRVEAIVVDLEFQFFIEAVEHFSVNAVVDGLFGHGRLRRAGTAQAAVGRQSLNDGVDG